MKKRNSIDFWRLIFCLPICALHSGKLLSDGFSKVFFSGGYISVEFFFMVSGFYLASSVDRMNANQKPRLESIGTETFNFILKRARRLYPEFICGFVLTLFLEFIIYNNSPLFYLRNASLFSALI